MTTQLDFNPENTLTGQITTVSDARLVAHLPPEKRTAQIVAGVMDADGQPVEASICWRHQSNAKTLLPRPEAAADVPFGAHKSGRWLFGGVLYGHFGHFLCESIARLWALDHVGPVEGVVFIPKKQMTNPRRAIMPVRPWLDIVGLDAHAIAIGKEALHFDELLIPPQGFGTGKMMAGSPEFRAYMDTHLGKDIDAAGPNKIYISRSKLYSKRGRYLGEDALEALLEAEGYTVFHPQLHDIDAQIAQYKAADVILSSDNSALHLAAFVLKPDARAGIILRRPGAIVDDFITQLNWNAGITPDIIDVLQPHHFQFGERRRNMNEVFTELDFQRLATSLRDNGYISGAQSWPALTEEQLSAECSVLAEKLGADEIHKVPF